MNIVIKHKESEYNRIFISSGGSRGGFGGFKPPPSSSKSLKTPPSPSKATKIFKSDIFIFAHLEDIHNVLVNEKLHFVHNCIFYNFFWEGGFKKLNIL